MSISDDLRQRLEDALDRPVSQEAWERLIQREDVGEVIKGQKSIEDWAAGIYAREGVLDPLLTVPGAAPQTLVPLGREALASIEPSRQIVLSYLVADTAAQDKAVQQFRQDPASALPPKLLPWDQEEIEHWIARVEGRGDRLGAFWLSEVPLEDKEADRLLHAAHELNWSQLEDITVRIPAAAVREQLQPRRLEYGVPGDVHERKRTIIEPRGVLDQLRTLSEELAKRYAWTPAQGSVFVLTGRVPLIAPLAAESHRYGRLPALGRIVLTIDPALPAKEVADQYSALRGDYVGPRHRELQPKHLTLALFAMTRPPGESWADSMGTWNALQQERHPDWVYKAINNFSRDCLAAQRRVLGERVQRDIEGQSRGKARAERGHDLQAGR